MRWFPVRRNGGGLIQYWKLADTPNGPPYGYVARARDKVTFQAWLYGIPPGPEGNRLIGTARTMGEAKELVEQEAER